ncbi:hypothetical protein L9F63_017956 [Diploptera punctata]|uniref:NACHT domain-containing protein n=1 Tax=Diploptera punctata TaxID=6984 RepID=A0AAD7ZYW6_DIPPU|nr:hypothetical protein L9F63_017956 [Diploptera punctata]
MWFVCRPTRRYYDKLDSCCTGRGLKYEHNMCSLAFARTMRLKYNFSLATNIKGCGSFDDVVLQFSKHDNKKKSFFIQMKSKAKITVGFSSLTSMSKNADFSLLKYFKSYLEIKENFENESVTPFDGKFEDILLVLYTNSDVTEELKNMLNDETRENDMLQDASNILLTNKENGGATLTLKLDGKICDTLVSILSEKSQKQKYKHVKERTASAESASSESVDEREKSTSKQVNKSVEEEELRKQVKEFLEKVIIMYKQTEEEHFDEVVKAELQQHFDLPEEDIQLAHKKFQQLFEDWWQNNYFLESSNKMNPIAEVKDYINLEHACQLIKHRKTDLTNKNIMFVNSAFKNIREIVENNQAVVIYSSRHTIQPTMAKINQLLSEKADNAILNLNDLIQNVENIMIAWKMEKFNILIIEICETLNRLNEPLSKIQEIIKEDEKKKIIFVSAYGKHINYMKIIKNTFKDLKKFQDTLKYPELTIETKESLLNKKVIFQGDTLLLSQILLDSTDFTIFNELDEESISILFSSEIPVIGSKLEATLDYYIDRKLQILQTVSEDILQDTDTVFAVDSKTLEKLNLTANFLSNDISKFVLVENILDFEELCGREKCVHWLKKDEERLMWKQSKGNLNVIRRHLITYDITEWMPETILDGDEKTILLTAEPGMGKSSFLSHLARMTKNKHPEMWLIHICINNFTKILEDIKRDGFHEDKALEMLQIAAGIKNPELKCLESVLFEKAYAYEGNMAVLIDGIDEVAPLYTREVIEIVKFFSNIEVVKIWVTSRNFMKDSLEDIFGIPSHSLVPFDNQEQELFLVKFWLLVSPEKDEQVLQRLASKTRRLVSSQFKNHETDFMGIPIQSLLIAETFILSNLTMKNINYHTLYELYVKKKWNIYLREKMNADPTNVNMSHDTSLYRKFIDNHKAAAVVSFLKADVLDEINSPSLINQEYAFIKNVHNGVEKTGIIHSVNNLHHAVFLHRTFCEYFVALWVFEIFMSNHQMSLEVNLENIQPVLKRLCDGEFNVVKSILERMLAKDFTVHTAILNDNEVEFKKGIEKCDLNEGDHGGRTPLHVASSCGNLKYVKILLDIGVKESKRDTLLGISSLSYAIRGEHWDIVTEILYKCPTSRDQELDEKLLKNVCLMFHILHCAKKSGYSDLVEYLTVQKGWILLKAGVHVGHIEFIELILTIGTEVNVSSPEGQTALHITAENNDCSLTRLLIMKDASANSADNSGTTPVHAAVGRASHAALHLLLQAGADVNLKTIDGSTALHIASKSGDLESVNKLLNVGSIVNITDNTTQIDHQLLINSAAVDGSSALHIASRYGHVNVARKLLSYGAFVNIVDKNGKFPLHVACEYGHVQVATMLLNNGAMVNMKDNNNCTPIMLANRNGYVAVKELLLSHGGTEEQVTQDNSVAVEEEKKVSKIERETARVARQVHNEGQRFIKRVKKLF